MKSKQTMWTNDVEHQWLVANTMKIIGMITMVYDHVGKVFFPTSFIFQFVGRIAFPCFLYGLVIGIVHTRDRKRYAWRMFLMGLATLGVSWYFGNGFVLNVGFSFVLIILGIDAFEKNKRYMFSLFLLLSLFTEYGAYGYMFAFSMWLILTERLVLNSQASYYIYFIVLHVAFISMFPYLGWMQLGGLLFFIVLNYVIDGVVVYWRIPQWFGYMFYPGHLLLLYLIQTWSDSIV